MFKNKNIETINNDYLHEREAFVDFILDNPDMFHVLSTNEVTLASSEKRTGRPIFVIKSKEALKQYKAKVKRLVKYIDYLCETDPDNFKPNGIYYRAPLDILDNVERVAIHVSEAINSRRADKHYLIAKLDRIERQYKSFPDKELIKPQLDALSRQRAAINAYDDQTIFRLRYSAGSFDTVCRITHGTYNETETVRVNGTGLPIYLRTKYYIASGDGVLLHNPITNENSDDKPKDMDNADYPIIFLPSYKNKRNNHLSTRADVFANKLVNAIDINFLAGTQVYLDDEVEQAKNMLKQQIHAEKMH